MLDMVVNERIYLSTCDFTNDADEGGWKVLEHCDQEKYPDKKYIQQAKDLRSIVDAQRYTCFVESINNPLMWAHYAGGFSGVAFEYDLDDSIYDIRKIDYHGTPVVSLNDMQYVLDGKCKPQDIGILKQKAKCWEYEEEWRLFGHDNSICYIDAKPLAVIFGSRTTKYDGVFPDIVRKYGISVGFMIPTTENKYKIQYVKACCNQK